MSENILNLFGQTNRFALTPKQFEEQEQKLRNPRPQERFDRSRQFLMRYRALVNQDGSPTCGLYIIRGRTAFRRRSPKLRCRIHHEILGGFYVFAEDATTIHWVNEDGSCTPLNKDRKRGCISYSLREIALYEINDAGVLVTPANNVELCKDLYSDSLVSKQQRVKDVPKHLLRN